MTNKKRPSVTVGPFAEAQANTERFLSRLYLAFVLDDTWKKKEELENAIVDAYLADDQQKIKEAEKELELFEGALELTANIMELPEEVLS